VAEPSKSSEAHPHTIKWDSVDWDRIEEATRLLGERHHIDLTTTDIIRSGARRFVEEILNGELAPAKAS
jgi:hypothetical protein